MSVLAAGSLPGEVCDLKRVRIAGVEGSLAEAAFRRAWAALAAGEATERVALRETARALAATKLAGIDERTLQAAGLVARAAHDVVARALDAACAEGVDAALAGRLEAALHDGSSGGEAAGRLEAALLDGPAGGGATARPEAAPHDGPDAPAGAEPPAFVARLAAQPRAGATAPGRPRLVLSPPESHADHCLVTAVIAVLLTPEHGATVGAPFLCGLAHHLHNARLPDAGFAGETLLGEHLPVMLATLREAELAELAPGLADEARDAIALADHVGSPEARAFVAADVLDRVLQMRAYERQSAFTLDVALDDLELVHAGPLQDFGLRTLAEAGLR